MKSIARSNTQGFVDLYAPSPASDTDLLLVQGTTHLVRVEFIVDNGLEYDYKNGYVYDNIFSAVATSMTNERGIDLLKNYPIPIYDFRPTGPFYDSSLRVKINKTTSFFFYKQSRRQCFFSYPILDGFL